MANHHVVCKEGTPVACFERRGHAEQDVSGRLAQDQKVYDAAQVFIAAAEALGRDENENLILPDDFKEKYNIADAVDLEEKVALAQALYPADETDYTITEV